MLKQTDTEWFETTGVSIIDAQRAQDIINSPNMIPVTYRGAPIHLDKVFTTNGYVKGHYEDGTVVNAPVQELKESSH